MALDEMKKQLQGLANRVDAMSLRERALIFITLLVALYFLAMNVLFGPLINEKDRLQQQVNQKRQEVESLESRIQSMATGRDEADTAKQRKIAALQENLRTMDSELVHVTAGLVSPKEMARLIEQMLLRNRGLQVMKVESIPAMPLLEGVEGVKADGTMIFKHGMQIEIKGGYMDILSYLKSLENLPWKVFWGKVTLKAEKYPNSRVSLLIYTLSTREGWIGL